MQDRDINQLTLSQHAQERCHQRGISQELLGVLYRFGKRAWAREGTSYSMDKKARLRAESALGRKVYRRIADRLDFYMIVALDGETVITVAHRL